MAIYGTQIKRRFATLQQAWYYLVLRGFNCRPFGDRENGRWAANFALILRRASTGETRRRPNSDEE